MLSTVSNGLLGSDFTWEDVNKIIEQKFGGAKLGDDTTIEPLAVGVGLQSLIGVVSTTWTDENCPLPNKFVLKIGSPLALIKALKAQSGKINMERSEELVRGFLIFLPLCHNSEIFFYENYETLKKSGITEIPEFYFGSKIEKIAGGVSKGCIGMEFIEDVQSLSPAQDFSEEQLKQVLRVIARLEAAFLPLSTKIDAKTPHHGLAGLYQTFPDWFVLLNNKLMEQIPHPKMKHLTAEFATTLPEIIKMQEIDRLEGKLGMQKVLVHGDLWSPNILWKGEHLEKIVDFQMIHFGMAVTDLSRIFNTALSPRQRRTKWREYLKYFHDVLTDEVGGERNLPYSYKQLELTYLLVYPRSSAMLLPTLTTVLDKVNTMPDNQEKHDLSMNLISKIIAIYEDVIDFHRNRPNYS
ncbi:unnamed protein product [Caenorhabditis bovis]|uniref:CHK kinase-like domain-containing protein n=1 Tax=Caenorhabditis bovis TaxID=2654633 RepID=A0A8S1F0C9_9PELO|nr:unnamed protein product [Caenorhabditis bovis]